MEVTDRIGHIITAAIAVLDDGAARTADEILALSLERGLVPPGTTRKYVYTALIEYIARSKGRERKPQIVQEHDRRFRANHPPDPWPTPAGLTKPAPSKVALDALDRAVASSLGTDPEEFEIAVCALFETLGFVSTHVGGNHAPDGYLDAPLGPFAYRVMLECKTARGSGIVPRPDVSEAARFREAYGAAHALLIGPAFASHPTFALELQTHGVSAWTIADLATVVHAGFGPAQLRPLFAPGIVADVVDDAVWSAAHGEAKRVAAICEALETIAVHQQRVALGAPASDAPLLDVDAAMMLLDDHFAALGSTARCSRADVEAAFGWLTHPRVSRAIWVDGNHSAIVVTDALRSSGASVRRL